MTTEPMETRGRKRKREFNEAAKAVKKIARSPEPRFRERSDMSTSFWVDDLDHDLWFEDTDSTWRPGPIFWERQIHEDVPSEASALCVAVQVKGQNIGKEAILRIRQQIPRDLYHPVEKGHLDYSWNSPVEVTYLARRELRSFRKLTDAKCTCVPHLIDAKGERQREGDHVPGGFRMFLLMKKLPGRDLTNFADLPLAERDRVRLAFAKAIHEFHALGCYHEDEHRRNLMWDKENNKVYIIDLEQVRYYGEPTWRYLSNVFDAWTLSSPKYWEYYSADPMVKKLREYKRRSWPTGEQLEKIVEEVHRENASLYGFEEENSRTPQTPRQSLTTERGRFQLSN